MARLPRPSGAYPGCIRTSRWCVYLAHLGAATFGDACRGFSRGVGSLRPTTHQALESPPSVSSLPIIISPQKEISVLDPPSLCSLSLLSFLLLSLSPLPSTLTILPLHFPFSLLSLTPSFLLLSPLLPFSTFLLFLFPFSIFFLNSLHSVLLLSPLLTHLSLMTESKPQAPPPTAARLEEVEPPLSLPAVEGPVGKTAVAPSILSAEHLHAQIKNVGGDSWRVGADAPPPAIPRDQDKKLPDEDEAKGAYKTYYTRFWILAVFSTLALPVQSTVWGTFGPILDSAEAAFGWTDATVAAFPNWGPVVVVTFTLPMMWFTQKLGLRLGMLACATLIFAGTLVRCFTSEPFIFTVLCHVGAVLNSFAACMTLSLPAMVAAVWFPPDERITATAVGALMCQLGGAAMYMGPLVVRSPGNGTSPEDTSETLAEDIRGDIMTLMYIPEDKPSFLSGIKSIAKNVQLLLVLGVYSFSFGVPVVWIGVLTFSLRVIDIHQEQAMGVAVVAVCVSSVAAFVIARITDKMYGHLRVTIIGLLLASAACFLWFVLISTGVIEPSLVQVYMSVTGGVSFEYASVPLLVELAVELGYPIPESVTGAALTFLFNVVALVFLGLFQIPSDYMWVSYVLLACVSLTIIPLMFVKETHKRSEADRKEISHITGSAIVCVTLFYCGLPTLPAFL
ncbi:hypothetical protein C7M84_022662 [Penaeus vannamei]|uniref:Uncharacterized protein n=1 Tax=Penaeus vannamei TaxID=6689 RepID=A0A3R7PVU1_PENVA|nr:hypothetical protein C7M84_022662 [Penaeus vannamei]